MTNTSHMNPTGYTKTRTDEPQQGPDSTNRKARP
jgi:hypothetical protein